MSNFEKFKQYNQERQTESITHIASLFIRLDAMYCEALDGACPLDVAGTFETARNLLLEQLRLYTEEYDRQSKLETKIITINGEDHKINSNSISYEEIVELAGAPQGHHLTIKYRYDINKLSLIHI